MNNFNEIKDFMKKFNKVKFCEEENCILLKRSNYFKIITRESDRNEIIILKKWNAGIIGKFLFKKYYKEFETILTFVYGFYRKRGYKISILCDISF